MRDEVQETMDIEERPRKKTLLERLEERRTRLSDDLTEVMTAISLLTANPELIDKYARLRNADRR